MKTTVKYLSFEGTVDGTLDPVAARNVLVDTYPEIVNADVQETTDGEGNKTIQFYKKAGTLGC